MLTYRIRRKGFRWTQGNFKTYDDAVAYAMKDWGFSKNGVLADGVYFQYELEGRAFRFEQLDSPIWAS